MIRPVNGKGPAMPGGRITRNGTTRTSGQERAGGGEPARLLRLDQVGEGGEPQQDQKTVDHGSSFASIVAGRYNSGF